MSSGRIILVDGTFVVPLIDWSASINTSTNQVTITAVFKAYTNGTTRNFSDNFTGSISIGSSTLTIPRRSVSIAIGGPTVITTIETHTATLGLNNDGSGSFWVTATGQNGGTSWSSTTGGQTLSFDYARPPTTPSVASFSRGSNGTTISLSASNATFYGSGAYYQYRWSYDNSNWSGENSMSGTSGSGSGFVNTNTIWVQVRAGDSEGVSGWSSSSSGIEGVPNAPGAAPTLTRTSDGASITVTSAAATRATAYSYRQSTDGVNWGGTVNISSGTSVTITGLVYDQIYYYQTLGRNGTGSGAWSATGSIAGAAPSFSGSGTDTTVSSPAIWGLPYTDGVTALRVRNYSVVPNTLPAGLSLNTATGAITGTPTSTTTFSSTFTITANNNAGTATTSATIAVISPVRVNTVDAGPTGPASFATGAVNVLTVTGPTASFKTGIVRIWNGSTFVPSRLA
jgi:hypothetical protein